MSDVRNVLFLCTGNSARSILAEALLDRLGEGRFRGFSAGSQPKGEVHPGAIELLQRKGWDVSGFRSKSWDEFARPGAPAIDYVITVCDNAAAEACPVWPGRPVAGHWGIADPAAVNGSPGEVAEAFEQAFARLNRRIETFLRLPLDQLKPAAVRDSLYEIGETADQPAEA